nr:unnamed protein product [Naegleria fowleri]
MDPIQSGFNFLVDSSSVQQQDSSPPSSFSNSVSTSHPHHSTSSTTYGVYGAPSMPGNTSHSHTSGSGGSNSAKFNFVDMTKDVEFKTRNKGDKSLKVNKQFRYNKRFQNNFFIFKAGQNSQQHQQQQLSQQQSFGGTGDFDSSHYFSSPPTNASMPHHVGIPPSFGTNHPTVGLPSDWNSASSPTRLNGRFVKRQAHSASATPTLMINNNHSNFNDSNGVGAGLSSNVPTSSNAIGSGLGHSTSLLLAQQPPQSSQQPQLTFSSTLNTNLAQSGNFLIGNGQVQGSNPGSATSTGFIFLDDEMLVVNHHFQQQMQHASNPPVHSLPQQQQDLTSMSSQFILSKEGISNLAAALSSQNAANTEMVPPLSIYPNGQFIVTNSNGQPQLITLTNAESSNNPSLSQQQPQKLLSASTSSGNLAQSCSQTSTTTTQHRLTHSQSFPQELFSSALATFQKQQQLEQHAVSKDNNEIHLYVTNMSTSNATEGTTNSSANLSLQHSNGEMEEDQWLSGGAVIDSSDPTTTNSLSGKRKRKLKTSPNTLFGFGTSSSSSGVSSNDSSTLNSQSSSIENSHNNSPNTLVVGSNSHMNDDHEEIDDEEEDHIEKQNPKMITLERSASIQQVEFQSAGSEQLHHHHHHKDVRLTQRLDIVTQPQPQQHDNDHHHLVTSLIDPRFVPMSSLNDDIFNPHALLQEQYPQSGSTSQSLTNESNEIMIHDVVTGKPVINSSQSHPKLSTSSSPHFGKNASTQFQSSLGTNRDGNENGMIHVPSVMTPPTGPIEDELDSFLNAIHHSSSQF